MKSPFGRMGQKLTREIKWKGCVSESPLKNDGPQFEVRLLNITECSSPALFSSLGVEVKKRRQVLPSNRGREGKG